MDPIRSSAFLLSVVAAAVVAAQEPAAPEPRPARPQDPLAEAFARARSLSASHKAPLLAFVLPPASAAADPAAVKATREAERKVSMLMTKGGDGAPPMRTARDVLLRQVQLLRGSQRGTLASLPRATDAQMVFAATVPVFASAEACRARPGERVVLLDPTGARIAGFELDLLDAAAFVERVGGPVLAEEALLPRRANVDAAALRALDEVRAARKARGEGAESPHLAQQTLATLSSHLVALGPVLVEEGPDGRRPALELWAVETARPPLGSEAALELGDPCPGCGMGYTPPGLMTVLKLIGP